MQKWIFLIILFAAFIAYPQRIYIKNLNADFSKFDSKNYETLKNAYVQASQNLSAISYEGIDTIKLDIPSNAKTIHLPNNVDFENVVFVVKNNQKDFTLFEYSNDLKTIEIGKESFCKSKYSTVKEFDGKDILLVVKDENPWVKERVGYGHPHIRQDLILIKNGVNQNEPIQPYDNIYSKPEFSYCEITNDSVVVKNLTFIRTDNSTYKTFCLRIKNANNIEISNLYIKTPESHLYGDAVLSFINCANIRMSDVHIDGTYSQKDKYGYGISMNNVYDCLFRNVCGYGNWGVFGTNNVNTVNIKDCDLNRFDIHCYGKDVHCYNTNFHNIYNQFSSFYGVLEYENCSFYNFIPVLIEGSYSAYTKFDVTFKNCNIQVDTKRPFLCNTTHSEFLLDSIRPELKKLEYPDIEIKNSNVSCLSNVKAYYIFHTYEKKSVDLYGYPKLIFNNVNTENIETIKLSNSILNYNKQPLRE